MMIPSVLEQMLTSAILIELKKEFPLGNIEYQLKFVRAISKGIAYTLIPYIITNAHIKMDNGIYRVF